GGVEADIIATEHSREAGASGIERRSGSSVIDFAVGTDACNGQALSGDTGDSVGDCIGSVVGRVGAADRDAADSDRLGTADVLIGKAGFSVTRREAITTDPVVGQCDDGIGGGVIDLVLTRSADAQGPQSDIRRCAGGGIGRVIGGIGAAERDAADSDGVCGADILIGKAGLSITCAEGGTPEASLPKT